MFVSPNIDPKTSTTAKAIPICSSGTVSGITAIQIGMKIPCATDMPANGVKTPPGSSSWIVSAER